MKSILIVGARGFIGFNAIQRWIAQDPQIFILAVDANTYADKFLLDKKEAYEDSINTSVGRDVVRHYILDVASSQAIQTLEKWCKRWNIDTIIDFHAESHVDNSISNPGIFFSSNVVGTSNLLELARRLNLRFHYVSTDEVVGPISPEEVKYGSKIASEDAPYIPSSPYSASKAGAELAVKCYAKTFGLRATISRCTNNFGPWQHPEKLIPLTVKRLLDGAKVPIYGNGLQRRFWIHVDQHVDAVKAIVERGIADGRVYNIAPKTENLKTNLELVKMLARDLHRDFKNSIEHIKDRLAHDNCYWLESKRMDSEIGWRDDGSFIDDLKSTLEWYKRIFADE